MCSPLDHYHYIRIIDQVSLSVRDSFGQQRGRRLEVYLLFGLSPTTLFYLLVSGGMRRCFVCGVDSSPPLLFLNYSPPPPPPPRGVDSSPPLLFLNYSPPPPPPGAAVCWLRHAAGEIQRRELPGLFLPLFLFIFAFSASTPVPGRWVRVWGRAWGGSGGGGGYFRIKKQFFYSLMVEVSGVTSGSWFQIVAGRIRNAEVLA